MLVNLYRFSDGLSRLITITALMESNICRVMVLYGMPQYLHADPRRKLTKKTLDQMIQSPAETWVKALFVYLYYYGVRISEALAVSVEDFAVDEQNFLSVNSITLKNPTQDTRTLWVPVDSPHIDFLLTYIKDTDAGKLWTYSRQWARVKLQETYPWITPHGFRHNRLDDFAQLGENPYALKSWAGWSDIRPGDSYVQSVDTKKMAKRFFK